MTSFSVTQIWQNSSSISIFASHNKTLNVGKKSLICGIYVLYVWHSGQRQAVDKVYRVGGFRTRFCFQSGTSFACICSKTSSFLYKVSKEVNVLTDMIISCSFKYRQKLTSSKTPNCNLHTSAAQLNDT